jgi:hypothetical protein
MKRKKLYLMLLALIATFIVGFSFANYKKNITIKNYTTVIRPAQISPDYSRTVIPPNIAPLNFVVLETGTKYMVKIYSSTKKTIDVYSRTGVIKIPPRRWQKLLNDNRGQKLSTDIYVKNKSGTWKRYETISNTIAKENIDDYLVYRFIKPIFSKWKNVAIYQRNLSNFDRKEILHGKNFGGSCINCHSFVQNSPDRMTIGMRSPVYGSATLLGVDGKVSKVGAKWGYTAWHPSGKIAVYSINKTRQFFHTAGMSNRDVVDLDSALCYYHVDKQDVKSHPNIAEKDRLETYPTWSPDGKYLYFCSAPILWEDRDQIPPDNFDQVKYDLRRISYDLERDEWGKSETVLSAKETNLSILMPRISPDGRFLIFCMCRYGCFPVYQPSSDLYLMDLQTGQYRKLDINSEYAESWHSWSSNSRWIAFSSKRRGGLFTRTYFSYVDEAGKVHKPFILPQKDPQIYDSMLQTYSVPELITGPVRYSSKDLIRAARSSEKIEVEIPLTGATPKTEGMEPWQQVRE